MKKESQKIIQQKKTEEIGLFEQFYEETIKPILDIEFNKQVKELTGICPIELLYILVQEIKERDDKNKNRSK